MEISSIVVTHWELNVRLIYHWKEKWVIEKSLPIHVVLTLPKIIYYLFLFFI